MIRTISARELLDVWERGLRQPPVQRALLLLAAATGEPVETLAQMSIGQRDGLLLDARVATFGSLITAVAYCPTCGEALELTFDADDIRAHARMPPERLTLQLEDYEVVFRLPNSLDVNMAAATAEPEKRLLERCLINLSKRGRKRQAHDLPETLYVEIAQRMAEADPQAEVELELDCPACGHTWLTVFDIVSYFWGELQAWAQRILREIHILARCYGWSENEILSIPPQRRQFYLQMAGGA